MQFVIKLVTLLLLRFAAKSAVDVAVMFLTSGNPLAALNGPLR